MATTSEEMAKLFDIDIEESFSSVDEIEEKQTKRPPFEVKAQDIKSIMTPEQETNLIKQAGADAKNKIIKPPVISYEDDINDINVEDVTAAVNDDIEKFQAEIERNSGQPEEKEQSKTIEEFDKSISAQNSLNPLDLTGSDYEAFEQIKSKYPQFVLDDGGKLFKDFYIFKLKVLKSALTKFPLLPVHELNKDLEKIKLDHFLDTGNISPELFQTKIDQAYKCRVRLSELVIQAYQQFPYWERMKELLTAKLWKDHDLKGTHRRDGLTLEHMFDIEDYYAMLKGYIESSQHIDNLLKAASESLSRQLTCLQIKEQLTGFGKVDNDLRRREFKKNEQDNLDSISTGTVIKPPKVTTSPILADFGVSSNDDIANL